MQRVYLSGLITILVALGVAVLALINAVSVDPARKADALIEVGKAALSAVSLVIVGVFLADQLRQRDAKQQRTDAELERERQRGEAELERQRQQAEAALERGRQQAERQAQAERDLAAHRAEEHRQQVERDRQALLSFRREAIDTYNRSKAVRAHLRAAGLAGDQNLELTTERLAELDAQMGILVEVQLTFERLRREAQDAHGPLRHAARASLEELLSRNEKELREVVRDWEMGRAHLLTGRSVAQLQRWSNYAAFTGLPGSTAERGGSRGRMPPTDDPRSARQSAFGAIEDALLDALASLQP